MVSLEALVAALTLVSVLILASNFAVTYINFRTSTLGDAATREQIMRERYSSNPAKRSLPIKREIKVSEPRIRDYGFKEWVKSLRPGADYPGYTHFNVTIRHTDWPSLDELADPDRVFKPTFEYPEKEELAENEKLKRLRVFHIETLREPQWEGGGKFIISPMVSYRLYADTADPNDVETLVESIRDIVLEMERGETIVEFKEPVKSKRDFKELDT